MARRRVTTVVIAPNAFKGSLTGVEAAAAMAAGVSAVLPDAELIARPIADGGDGSVDCLLAAGYESLTIEARGPTGVPHSATIAASGDLAVVEMANTCGLLQLPGGQLAPMTATTRGLGDAVLAALDLGFDDIVICVGGGAATDGGTGMLEALGARYLDSAGQTLPAGGLWLGEIQEVDFDCLDPRLRDARVRIATDVDNPLYGSAGAAHVFAPQKGANKAQVAQLDEGLRSWAEVVRRATALDVATSPGTGAAGGTGFAALTALHAEIVPGADFIAEATGLRSALVTADLVLTGEGSLDKQSLRGKGAVYVARLAQPVAARTAMICGRIELSERALRELGIAAWGSLSDNSEDPGYAMTHAAELLARRTIEVVSTLR
jgi:glycerate kinase